MMNLRRYFSQSLFLLFLYIASSVNAQVIPVPLKVVKQAGTFHLDASTSLYTNLKGKEKEMLNEYLHSFPVRLKAGKMKEDVNVVKLVVTPLNWTSDKEAYMLDVMPDKIEITGNTGAGLFYGMQTLLQLAFRDEGLDMCIPCVRIEDRPRFGYRGFMLDVSRHFFPKEFVLKMLDILAYYKINIFHFHLVDTGGWRIEMNNHPNLTKMTAYRPAENLGDWRGMRNAFCLKEDANAYGGYYTKDDIREIVHYAMVRHITVIPEIDMPGHSRDVLCAYPELACDGKDYFQSNELCIGKEETFRFCESILLEIMELFPSRYIHIGGDEANRGIWNTCPSCQKRMHDEHIESVAGLQNYFTNRIEQFLNAHGKTMIGWDEILDSDVSKRAVVMSWREEVDGAGDALRRGHSVIMTPTSHCYLDYYQDIPYTQPITFGYIPLEKTYGFNPVSLGSADCSRILGVQGNLWTENVPTASHAEYMAFPRILAIAEVGWSVPERKSYPDFHKRALQAIDYLESKGFHPFPLKYEIGSRPEAKSPVQHLAIGKKVTYRQPYNTIDLMGSGATTLTDGLLGDWGLYGSRWQGYNGEMDVVIDLETIEEIHSITQSFMQVTPASIWLPARIEIEVSDDGESYIPLLAKECKINDTLKYDICSHVWEGCTKARYIRVHATRNLSWGSILCDEIIVK